MNSLKQLEKIAKVHYDQHQQRFTKIIQEETRLRNELARLDHFSKDQMTAPDQENSMKSIGADVLWHGWLGRTKTNINLELARILAKKDVEKIRLGRSFGKLIALQSLIESDQESHNRARSKNSLRQLIEHSFHCDRFDQ